MKRYTIFQYALCTSACSDAAGISSVHFWRVEILCTARYRTCIRDLIINCTDMLFRKCIARKTMQPFTINKNMHAVWCGF